MIDTCYSPRYTERLCVRSASTTSINKQTARVYGNNSTPRIVYVFGCIGLIKYAANFLGMHVPIVLVP